MDQCLSFKDLATSIEPFDPSFAEDFRKYMEESIRRSQIEFVRGRLHFNEAEQGAPFPSMVVIFDNSRLTAL